MKNLLIIYLFSSAFRVGRTVGNMVIYQGYQQLSTVNVDSSKVLGNYYVASAYNAAHSGYQMYDYTSEKIVLSIIQSGVRYLEFNVFNDSLGFSCDALIPPPLFFVSFFVSFVVKL